MSHEHVSVDKRAVLSRHDFFSGARVEVLERLASHARQVAYPARAQIFSKGDEGRGLLAVLSGVVRISVASTEAKEVLINLVGPTRFSVRSLSLIVIRGLPMQSLSRTANYWS
jgi:hypothetical protein